MNRPPELATSLHAAGLGIFPLKQDKSPAVKGWQSPSAPDAYKWPSGKVGILIKKGLVVFDLDKQKGVTEHQIETTLKCNIPWDLAFIQHTPNGGSHYAFRCNQPIRQGTNVLGVVGFDTRVAGKGYIATGDGYTSTSFEVYKLAYPANLPELPPEAVADLSPTKTTIPAPQPVKHPSADTDQVINALRHIDPGCDRSTWRDIGFALKAQYQEEDALGYQLFESWSAGEYWPDGMPPNYVSDGPGSTTDQWTTFKAEGKIRPATLFYRAIRAGWLPPKSFGTAAVFGPGAAHTDLFRNLVGRIRSGGADSMKAPEIVEEIQTAGCNTLQPTLLAAELKTELAGTGLTGKAVSMQIDGQLRVQSNNKQPRFFLPELGDSIQFEQGENTPFDCFHLPKSLFPGDDVNDALHLLALFQNRLCIAVGKFYWWSGRLWEPLTDSAVKRSIGLAIRGDNKKATSSRVKNIFEEMRNQGGLLDLDPPAPRVYFLNGVLHVPSGEFTHHDPGCGNTRTLSVDYIPSAQCPQWLTWLNEIFQIEPERMGLLQEQIGWALVRDCLGIEKALLFIGPPRAGKGVIARCIQALLGTGATSFRLNELDDSKMLAAMRGKNLVIDPDAVSAAPRNARAVMGLFKAITANDPIALTLLYTQEPWNGQLSTKFLILANSVPSMFDDSAATANRWVPLVFDRSYLGTEDPELSKRLMSELTGIAAWSVSGLLRLGNRRRFQLPKSSVDQLNSMTSESGSIQNFIDECLQIKEVYRSSEAQLWDAYRQWAVNSGHELGKRRHALKSLEDALRGRGVRRAKSVRLEDGRDHRGFYGISVLPVENARNILAFRPNDS